ncbi:hypothetical protein BU25DRAFT_308565, partial [Macroventuria anomochaeta]
HKHQQLDLSRNQIRVLLLLQGHAPLTINCIVTTFDVANTPPYITVSYARGEAHLLETIQVNYGYYSIRRNLFDFLSAFQENTANHMYLWIDQICIDQKNIEERNHQVQQMQHIYKSCKFVIS